MMYNRYIPGSNGVYERHTVAEATKPCPQQTETQPISSPCETERAQNQQSAIRAVGNSGLDWGDLLFVCIVLLLLIDSEEEDVLPILIMAAAFVLLQ